MLLGSFFRGYIVTMFPGAVLSQRLTAHNQGLLVCLILSSVGSALCPLAAGCNVSTAAWLRALTGAAQVRCSSVRCRFWADWLTWRAPRVAALAMEKGPLFPLISGVLLNGQNVIGI